MEWIEIFKAIILGIIEELQNGYLLVVQVT